MVDLLWEERLGVFAELSVRESLVGGAGPWSCRWSNGDTLNDLKNFLGLDTSDLDGSGMA